MAQIGETELDIHALSKALGRRVWLLALLAVVAAVGTYVGLGFVDPLYTADTRILIEERESPLTRTRDQASAPAADFDESAIQSQVEVLRSRGIADAVIDKLDLTRRIEFDPAREPSVLRSLLVMLGMGQHPADASIRQRVMDSYFKRISVYPLQKSHVIGVEFAAPDPELAAEVANAIAEAFVVMQQDAKRESAVAATAWLEQEIERLRERVAEAEQAVADYRADSGLFDVDQRGTESGNLSTQQLGDINAELARARAARAEAEARADLVQSLLAEGGALEASGEVLSSPLVQRLRERQGALRAQVAELSTTLLPGHPRIRALEGQVANLEGQIRQEAEKILASLHTAARVAAARENSLMTSLDTAKGDVSRSNDEEIPLRALQREAVAQRELLESFLSRYREASARTDANYLPADARIISRAVSPQEPSFPKKTMMSLAAAIAVLLIGTALVLLREFTSGRAFRVIGYGVPYSPVRPQEPVQDAAAPLIASNYQDISPLTPAASEEPELPLGPQQPKAIEEESPEVRKLADEGPAPTTFEAEIEDDEFLEDEPSDAAILLDDRTSEDLTALSEDEFDSAETAPEAEHDRTGTAELAEIISNPGVRLALFAGAEGGEGAGEMAYSAARVAARDKLRCIVIDVGKVASEALGDQRPGLTDLLAGEAAFGEVIRRDEDSGVHVIPLGPRTDAPPSHRMRIVVNALTHSYDKVIVVADRLDDWPDEYVRPDVAAIVCGPDTTESFRTEVYDIAVARGARSAIIVRYASDHERGEASEAA